MTVKPIRTDDDLRAAFMQLQSVFQAEEGTIPIRSDGSSIPVSSPNAN